MPAAAKLGRVAQRFGLARAQGRRRRLGGDIRVALEPVDGGVEAVDHDRPEAQADTILEREGGFDQLVYRCLLRKGHEHDLAPRRVGEEVEDLMRLGADRTDASGVEEPAWAHQEAHGVTGRGGVEHDQVGDARPLELLDLAEDQDVLDTGHRRRHDVDGPAVHQPLRHPPQPMVLEVLEQGVVGRERARPHVGLAAAPAWREHDLLVAEAGRAERRRQPALAFDLDHEGPEPGACGHQGERGRDRRLAHTALARNDDDAGLLAEARWIQPSPFGEATSAD